MTIYAEIIFISNFFIDLFIFILTLIMRKSAISKKRIVLLSIVGGIISALLPLIYKYTIYIKILCLIILPFFMKKHSSFTDYLLTLSVFIIITLVLGGACFAIKCSINKNIGFYFSYGIIPIMFSISGVCIIILFSEIRKSYLSVTNYEKNRTKVIICDGDNSYEGNAFFDSGNRVYANNGDPVTIVNEKIYNMFCGMEEDIEVMTITGTSVLRGKDVEIKIYSDKVNNMIYKTKIAIAPFLLGREEIILHGDMIGG